MDSVTVKPCGKCGIPKPVTLEYFYKHKTCKDGFETTCKDCWKVSSKAHYQANKPKYAAFGKAWRDANPGRDVAYSKAYRERHPERFAANQEAWRLANPEKVKANGRIAKMRRRARNHNAPGTHTATDIVKQFAAQKGKCWWCGCKLVKSGKGKFHADHRDPLSKGGSNGPENMVCACPTCNLTKNAKTPLEFAGRLF